MEKNPARFAAGRAAGAGCRARPAYICAASRPLLMPTSDLPATKILTFLSDAKQAAAAAPVPFSRVEILAFPEVKAWLAKGYELDSFENKLSPKNQRQVILLVLLTRTFGE